MQTDAEPAEAAPLDQIVLDLSSAVADLEQNLHAYEAIEQIVTADSLRAESHLPLLKRDSLAALLGVLNSSLSQRCVAARAATNRVASAVRAGRGTAA
ncbi:hypothetical protein PEC18_12140 [Paucibacter sp. O1-1]|nr:hypothetical protein [Paucibacter sp. O1-1]MDA3826566.1 hypothetical protein [Paucibacter sp. O1-1]